jgi:hypothetical protein
VRFVVSVLLLVGCGRFGFGTAIDGGGDDANPPEDGDGDGPGANDIQVKVSVTGQCPSVAWSGTRIGVTWREGTNFGPGMVMFAALDPGGSVIQGPLIVRASDYMECPSIVWSGAQFLVAFAHGQINRRDIDVAIVNSSGLGAITNVVNDSGDSTAPQLAHTGGTVLVAWSDQQGTNYNANVRALTTTGVPTQPPLQISGLVSSNGPPRLTVTPGGFAAAWAGGNAIRLRMFNTSGTPTTNEVANPSMASGGIPVVWNGSELIAAWSELGGNTIITARFSTTGAMTAGPYSFPEAAPDRMAMVETSTGAALLFAEMSSLVQFHLAYLAPTGEYISQEPMNNASTDSWASLVRADQRLIAGMDNGGGALVRVIEP